MDIIKGDVFHDSKWEQIEYALEHPAIRTMYLFGAPGIGKTYSAMRHGLSGRNVYVTTLTPETPASELRGHYLPVGGGDFAWHHGIFAKGMLEGARVVVNEPTHASYDVQAFLYAVMESAETARFDLPDGQVVTPKEGFEVILTDNEGPAGLPAALRNRCQTIFEIDEPHPSGMSKLTPRIQDAAMRCFSRRVKAREIPSLRGWMTFQDLEPSVGTETAFEMVFGEEMGRELFKALIVAGTKVASKPKL